MKILSILHRPFSKRNSLLFIISNLTVLGTFVVLMGGIWDSASHALRVPENFWTIQHISIYIGVSIIASSAILGTIVSIKNKKFSRPIIIILVGAIMQLGGGFVDYNFHEIYGIDGLVTPSHLSIESGLFLSALGGFLIISKFNYRYTRTIGTISIITVFFSGVWICFNLSLLVGGTLFCIPVYELFSSGCAIM